MIHFRFVAIAAFLTLLAGIWMGRIATERVIGSSPLARGAGLTKRGES